MIAPVAWTSVFVMILSTVLCLMRLARGPSSADQLMAYGTMGSMSIAVFALLGIVADPLFLEALVPIALVSFVSLLLIAKFLEAEV